MHTCDGFNIYYHLGVHKNHKAILFIHTVFFKGMIMTDNIKSMEALERIALIAKVGSFDSFTSQEKDIVLSLIFELADNARVDLLEKNKPQNVAQ